MQLIKITNVKKQYMFSKSQTLIMVLIFFLMSLFLLF